MTHVTARERAALEMIGRIERTLEFAAGATPQAFLTSAIGGGDTIISVDSTLGYPPSGVLLLEPGGGGEERAAYDGIDTATHRFLNVERGVQCTPGAGHQAGTVVHFGGMAVATEEQVAPMAGSFDGRAQDGGDVVFFRGQGTAHSFRVPTDPAGGTDFFDDTGVTWGATIGGNPTLDGWSALAFRAVGELREDEQGRDLNGDGDATDVFDLGAIRLESWDAFTLSGASTETALCPPVIVQERCNWGGDLDGDGFDDPIFLWNQSTRTLHVRLFVVGRTVRDLPIVRRIESVMFLRNENGL
jgi:hypothetical protein